MNRPHSLQFEPKSIQQWELFSNKIKVTMPLYINKEGPTEHERKKDRQESVRMREKRNS